MPIKKVLLTLARVGLYPRFLQVRDPRGYPRSISQVCLSFTEDLIDSSKSKKKRRKLLKKREPGPNFPCSGFLMRKEVSRVKDGENGLRYSLDPNDYGLPSPELPLSMKHMYAFGLFSLRITVPVFLRKNMNVNYLIRGWRGLAFAFREFLDGQFSSNLPDNWFSNYFTEVYVLEGTIDDIGEREAKMILSPLKNESFPQLFAFSERDGARDPMVVSTDGILIRIQRSGGGHRDQRRKMRRAIRIAVDIILGQKTFYTSPTLWRKESSSWGAMVGLIYLNPNLWRSGYFHPSRKFYAIYRRILRPFREFIEGGYRSYSSGYGKFLEGTRISDIHPILLMMYKLGLTIPEIRVPLISKLEGIVLTMLCFKESLDRSLRGSRRYLKDVSEKLCREFNEREGSCLDNLRKKIGSREERRGLSVEEMEVLLGGEYNNPRGIIRKKGIIDSLMNLKLIRRCGRVSRSGSGYPRVEIYCPEAGNDYVAWLLSLINRRSYP